MRSSGPKFRVRKNSIHRPFLAIQCGIRLLGVYKSQYNTISGFIEGDNSVQKLKILIKSSTDLARFFNTCWPLICIQVFWHPFHCTFFCYEMLYAPS